MKLKRERVNDHCTLYIHIITYITQIFSYNLQASTDSLDSAEDFTPVEINLGEIKEMLSMYRSKRRVSTSALGTNK